MKCLIRTRSCTAAQAESGSLPVKMHEDLLAVDFVPVLVLSTQACGCVVWHGQVEVRHQLLSMQTITHPSRVIWQWRRTHHGVPERCAHSTD